LKHTENGKGIRSRWYPETLRKRIQNIKYVREKITFVEGDGIEAVKKYASDKEAAFFIDPPYTAAGKRAGSRLYTHCELDHEELFEQCGEINGSFLMTYDVADELMEMAKTRNFRVDKVSMKNTHHSTMQELVIGKDLSWVGSPAQ
jgi:DNA adenine methylase